MAIVRLGDLNVHYRDDGPSDGPVVVFSNSLGSNLQLWDGILPHLPKTLRLVRYDMRGHGLSDVPPAPYKMGTLITDAERLLDHLEIRDCVFVGLSIGGMIAQGLAVKRMDQLRAIVLSNTATKIGTPQMWAERIAACKAEGIEAIADMVIARWFGAGFLASPDLADWRDMLVRTPLEGYVGCCAAISGADFLSATSGLRLPTLAIAGSEDGSTPPDMVREVADLIPGSEFHLIRNVGHLPCVERPADFARHLVAFLSRIGHV